MSFIQAKCAFHFIFVGLVLSIFHQSNSQTPDFKHFTTQDGLPSSVIYEAIQDRHGFMWFATPVGVSRFDGYKFTNYTVKDGLGDNEIFGFCEDSMGRIWFRSLNGKVSYF